MSACVLRFISVVSHMVTEVVLVLEVGGGLVLVGVTVALEQVGKF